MTVAYNNMNDKRPFNADRASYGVAYTYALSKRTDLYAVYMNDKRTGVDSGNTLAVGVRHRF